MGLKRTSSVILNVRPQKRTKASRKSSKKSWQSTLATRRPFAQEYTTQLKYVDWVATNLGVAIYRFRLNSIFDPDLTGVGHQPYGHDTLQSIYNKYRVTKIDYEIRALSAVPNAHYITITPSNDAGGLGTYPSPIDITEAPQSKSAMVTAQCIGGGVGGSGATLKGSVSLPHFTGRTMAQYCADDVYEANYGNNPVENMSLNIAAIDQSGAYNLDPMHYMVKLLYTVVSFDPKVLPQS